MRIDTVAQLLTYANVAAFRNVMVVESCKGLILSAVAERVGGNLILKKFVLPLSGGYYLKKIGYGKILNFCPNGTDNTTK